MGDVLGQVGRPLLARQYAHRRHSLESLFSPRSQPRAHAIIAAQRIAAGENQAPDGMCGWMWHARDVNAGPSTRPLKRTSLRMTVVGLRWCSPTLAPKRRRKDGARESCGLADYLV